MNLNITLLSSCTCEEGCSEKRTCQRRYVSRINGRVKLVVCTVLVHPCVPLWFQHCVKSVQILRFSGLYFAAFGLNMEIYWVNLRIGTKYSKIWTRKNYVFGHFSRSVRYRQTWEIAEVFYSIFPCMLSYFKPIFHFYTPWKCQKHLWFSDIFMV